MSKLRDEINLIVQTSKEMSPDHSVNVAQVVRAIVGAVEALEQRLFDLELATAVTSKNNAPEAD